MKTYYTPVNEIDRKWYVVDADGKVLGRFAIGNCHAASRQA